MRKFFLTGVLFSFLLSGCGGKNLSPAKENERKGDYYFSSGNIEKAISFWKKSLKEKKGEKVYEKLSSAFIIKGDFKGAEEVIKEGLTYFPHCGNLIFNLALVKFYTGEYEKAMEQLNMVLKMNKYYPNAHYLKGMIYQEKGEIEKAKKEFINEININPGSKRAWQKLKEMKDEK